MESEIEALTSALESLKAISIESNDKPGVFNQSSVYSNSNSINNGNSEVFDSDIEKEMILKGINELNEFFEDISVSKLRVNARVNALEKSGQNEGSKNLSVEKRYDQEHEQRARTLVSIYIYVIIYSL